jgi:hypothetical protein
MKEHFVVFFPLQIKLINYNILEHNISSLKSDTKVGTPFVIMCFRLVDIWSTLYNIKAGNLAKDIGMPIVHKLINDYVEMRNKMNNMPIDKIFSINYVGNYEDQQLNKMRVASKLRIKFIPPYIPYFNKENNDKCI